jgi:hypothetical protein
MTTTTKKSALRRSASSKKTLIALNKPAAASKTQKDKGAGRPPAEAYRHFLPDAQGLPGAGLETCRVDPALALHNVQLGVDSVRPHAARLRKELPALKLEDLWSLADLAAGLIYAADRVSGPASKAEVTAKLVRLRRLREPMLIVAEALAMLGMLPSDRVAAIRAGKGPMDSARDGIALEALYREYAAKLAGKHPFSDADFQEVAELGSFLVRAITPDGGRQRPEATSEAAIIRDRFYTLLVLRHAELRKAGFYLFGEAVDAHVPPLGSRIPGSRKGAGKDGPEAPAVG